LARGWKMFAAAGARKALTSVCGRKSPQILPLTPKIMGKPSLENSSAHLNYFVP
jgi:hypothetical protein